MISSVRPAWLIDGDARWREDVVEGEHVLARWTVAARAEAAVVVLPDGCVDVVDDGTGEVLVGPSSAAQRFELGAGQIVRGVRYRPGSAPALFGVGGREIVDGQLPVPAVRPRRRDEVVDRAVLALGALPLQCSMRSVAAELGVPERSLRARFVGVVGVAPKRFQQIVRVHAAVRSVQATGRPWAQAAHEAGFADQAHLVRTVRSLTGTTPSRLPIRSRRSSGGPVPSVP